MFRLVSDRWWGPGHTLIITCWLPGHFKRAVQTCVELNNIKPQMCLLLNYLAAILSNFFSLNTTLEETFVVTCEWVTLESQGSLMWQGGHVVTSVCQFFMGLWQKKYLWPFSDLDLWPWKGRKSSVAMATQLGFMLKRKHLKGCFWPVGSLHVSSLWSYPSLTLSLGRINWN